MKYLAWLPFISIAILLFPIPALAKPLVADLSQYRIDIDSSYTGTRLLLFGARNDIGDVVVVVRGPEKQFTVWRRKRIAGIWVNYKSEQFDNVPAYYTIASSKPFSAIHNTSLFSPLNIGLEAAVNPQGIIHNSDFTNALIRHQQSTNLYSQAPQKISFMGESLFKLLIPFPDNIPGGDYSADVYLFNDGQLLGIQSIPIHVEKTGLDAFIYDFAHSHSIIYGLAAVLLALGMGWGASSLMRRI